MRVDHWVTILVNLEKLRKHTLAILQHKDAMDRIGKGQQPFPSKPEVEAALSSLDETSRAFDELARNGIGTHKPTPVSMAELANPASRSSAQAKLRSELAQRESFLANGRKVVGDAERLSREAPERAKALREVRDTFAKLMQAPLPLGTAFQAQALSYSQLFERASGRMASVGSAATRAVNRVRPELTQYEKDTETLRANLRTFGIL
jgi:hypothetical protein